MTAQTIAFIALAVAFAIQTYITGRVLFRHQRVLEWFAQHIKLDSRNIPAGIPKDLQALIKEEANIDDTTKS
jgi:hypothetical protein